MIPKTSVSPAAIRNSITPNCSPLRHCSTTRSQFNGPVRLPLHRTLLVVGVLVVLEDGLLDLHLHVPARALHRPQQVEVLDRGVVDVEAELAARRAEVGLAHGRDHPLLVAEVSPDGAHGGVDQEDAVVALGAVERGRVPELLLEVAHVLRVRLVLEVGAPVARLVVAERGLVGGGERVRLYWLYTVDEVWRSA